MNEGVILASLAWIVGAVAFLAGYELQTAIAIGFCSALATGLMRYFDFTPVGP
jgi:hypothetical protein